MIKVKQDNHWAVDISLHIPIPSVSIKITGKQKEEEMRSPLHKDSKDNKDEKGS